MAPMSSADLRKILIKTRVIPVLAGLLPPGETIYLVGGALRNWRLGRATADFDFASAFDPTELARRFAAAVGGHWFFLDEERRQSRVAVRSEDAPPVIYDFAPFRAEDLAGDLRLRDFTINAVALPILAGDGPLPLIDPLGGLADLQHGILRGCSAGVFGDDPLRILKGIRHSAALGVVIEPRTLAWMREASALLPGVAAERVRSELAGIFAAGDAVRGVLLLRELGLLDTLFGQPAETGGFQEGVGRLERAMEVIDNLAAMDRPLWLDRELEAGLSRRALLRLAAFLHGYHSADPEGIAEKWRCSRHTASLLRSLVAIPPTRVREAAELAPSRRGRALWAAGLGPGPCEHLAFLPVLSEEPPAKAVERVLPILDDFRAVAREGRVPDLVDGDWIRRELQLEGPAVGRALDGLRQEEIAGRVRTEEEGRGFLRKSKGRF